MRSCCGSSKEIGETWNGRGDPIGSGNIWLLKHPAAGRRIVTRRDGTPLRIEEDAARPIRTERLDVVGFACDKWLSRGTYSDGSNRKSVAGARRVMASSAARSGNTQ